MGSSQALARRRAARSGGAVGLVLVAMLWAAPARAQNDDDPLEPVNRAVFEVNRVLDGLLLKPAAIMYRAATPEFVRDGVTNFLSNLRAPVVLVNDLLQGDFERAEVTLGRFMFNTIMGLGGLVDVGTRLGMPERHSEDFGQTLAVWGVGEGIYLVLPILGPSNPRDGVGRLVDVGIDPISHVAPTGVGFFIAPTELGLARFGAEAVSFRERNLEQIDELERSSIDPYAAVRTFYRQFRANEIRNGAPADLEDIYDEDIYNEDIYDENLDGDPKAGDGQ